MFNVVLNLLIKRDQDSLSERLDKDKNVQKLFNFLGGVIVFSLLSTIIMGITVFKNQKIPPRPTFAVTEKNSYPIRTLPYPHQSIKNVQSWLTDAIMASYSFSFSKYQEQVDAAEFYFTPEGYKTYLTALAANKIEETVVNKNLKISIIPIQQPVSINNGTYGDTEFWRFRVPAIVSYYGGKEVINQKFLIETLVIRVPAYKNHRAFGIAEFNMQQM